MSQLLAPRSVLILLASFLLLKLPNDSSQQLVIRGDNKQHRVHVASSGSSSSSHHRSNLYGSISGSQSYHSLPRQTFDVSPLMMKSPQQQHQHHQQQQHLQQRSTTTPSSSFYQQYITQSVQQILTSDSNSNSKNNNNQLKLRSQSTSSSQQQQQQLPVSEERDSNNGPGSYSQLQARHLHSSRGARNASLSSSSSSGSASWHFPRISTEHAAEVLLTGAQVINRIAQVETPLNYCKTPDNQEGECSDIRKCIWLVLDKARLKQSVCLRNLIIPAVCCPISPANNTPIANMIQSTLEPVLFRPKAPKQSKQQQYSHLGSPHMKPFASIVNRTVVGMPPPSPVSLIIRNQLNNSNNNGSGSYDHTKGLSAPQQAPIESNTIGSAIGSHFGPTIESVSGLIVSAAESALHHLADHVHASSSTTTQLPTSSLSAPLPSSSPPSSTSTQASSATTTTSTAKPSSSTSMALFQDEDNSAPAYSPAANSNASAAHSRLASQKYPWANETCGEGSRTRTGRIVGGTDSKLGQWPWMTAMYLNKRSPFSSSSSNTASSSSAGEFWCGGALINRRYILTAAHCLSDQRGNRYKNDQVTIKLGGVDLVRHQAPADILRNAEADSSGPPLPASSAQTLHSRSNEPASRHHGRRWPSSSGSNAGDSIYYNNGHNRQQRDNDNEDEEFSWTSFIAKMLGFGSSSGPSGSTKLTNLPSSSASSSSSSYPSSLVTSDADSGNQNSDTLTKKQQLAARAKKAYFKEYKVASIKQHPKFQRHGFYNDIGLIELKSEVDYDDLISPICLPTEHDLKRDLSGFMATVLGWGTLSYGGQGSKLLQQVSMPIWNNKDCDDRYLQPIGRTFLCAGFLTGGKDACQGDSGGPLMVGDKSGRWTLHGVVSFGKTCAQAGYPGVYTRVTEYLDWIRDNTEPGAYYNSHRSSSSKDNQQQLGNKQNQDGLIAGAKL